MASQISHIIYAKKYFSKNFVKNINEFILGCVFPDIRRIDKNIKREETHSFFQNIDLNFQKISSFKAGWKFHLYCDKRREEILNNKNFYKLANTQNYAGLPTKLLEDEIIYASCQDWKNLAQFFKNLPAIEEKINVSQETFNQWYVILAEYIKKKPDKNSLKIFLSKQYELKNYAEEIVEIVFKLRQNKDVIKILQEIKEEII